MADPLAAQIELALQPDAFIPDAACSAFVSHLDEVAARIAPLTNSDVGEGQPEQALAWVERGIELRRQTPQGSLAGHELTRLKGQLPAKLDRGNKALEGAWADYRNLPSRYTDDELMRFVPAAERSQWRAHAMRIVDAGKSRYYTAALE